MSASKTFKPASLAEVKLLSYLWLEQSCISRRPMISTKKGWNVEKNNLKDCAPSIARKMVDTHLLHKLEVKSNSRVRLTASYSMIEAVFKTCVDECMHPLVNGRWSDFEDKMNQRIQQVLDKLETLPFHTYVLDYSKYTRMHDYAEYDLEEESELSESSESSSSENDSDSDDARSQSAERSRSLEDVLLLVVNDMKKQAQADKPVTVDSKELAELLKHRKSTSKAVDIKLFDGMEPAQRRRILETLKKVNAEKTDMPLLFQLLTSGLPPFVINEAMTKFENSRTESESTKFMTWIHSLLKMPFNTFVEPAHTNLKLHTSHEASTQYFNDARKQLDSAVYGHKDAKDQLIKYIAQLTRHSMTQTTRSKGLVLGIQGPCGNGKTTLIEKGVSKVLGLPFAAIPLGGATDNAFLNGHSYTYEGSVWGQIADVLMKTKCLNPIIYMDELDKVSTCHKGQEIIHQLIHLTDPSQNSHFQDRYFGNIDIDLSHVTFIFSYNDASNINHILRDRITEVKTSGFTLPDKLQIAERFLVPSVCREIGMPEVSFSQDTIRHMVEAYTYEGGVRKIKELIFDVCRSLNVDDLCGHVQLTTKRRKMTENGKYSISVDKVKEYLKHKHIMQKEKVHTEPTVGRINGLYASSTIDMGGIIAIETRLVPSDNVYGLSLTGNLGNVMKESGTVAKTLAWRMLNATLQSQWGAKWAKTKESIHIHCPEGAVNKDGPSAGTALTVSILSLLTGNPIRNDVAITGEINLSGDVLAIGGLRSKLYGAKSAGCKLALYPADNTEDYKKIERECTDLFDDSFRAVAVSSLHQVLPLALTNVTGIHTDGRLNVVPRKSKRGSNTESRQHNKRKYNTRNSK